MATPIRCVYCREPIARHRDHYVLVPPESPAGGSYRLAHLACADGRTRDAEPHPTAGMREPIPDPFGDHLCDLSPPLPIRTRHPAGGA